MLECVATVLFKLAAMGLGPMTFHDARLASGLRLRYARQGPSGGPTVILLHGYGDSSFSFSRVMPMLPSGVQVIAPDQRGHGDSDRPADGYAMDDLATDAIQLMDALEITSAVIVGHSMGSFVARRVAARVPGRVTGLVLMGAAPSPANDVLQGLRQSVGALSDPIEPAFVREFQYSTVSRPVPKPFMDRVVAESLKVPSGVWKAALAGLLAFTADDQDIRCVTFVIGGDKDSVFSRAEQEAVARHIPSATVSITEGIGHALHWEDPELFAATLTRAIRSAALVRR